MRFPIVTIALADVLPLAIVVAVQSIHHKGVCPYSAHLFIDVLAKVGYVKNATSIIQVRISQIFPKAFEQQQRDLSLVRIHDGAPLRTTFLDNPMVVFLMPIKLCNFEQGGY